MQIKMSTSLLMFDIGEAWEFLHEGRRTFVAAYGNGRFVFFVFEIYLRHVAVLSPQWYSHISPVPHVLSPGSSTEFNFEYTKYIAYTPEVIRIFATYGLARDCNFYTGRALASFMEEEEPSSLNTLIYW